MSMYNRDEWRIPALDQHQIVARVPPPSLVNGPEYTFSGQILSNHYVPGHAGTQLWPSPYVQYPPLEAQYPSSLGGTPYTGPLQGGSQLRGSSAQRQTGASQMRDPLIQGQNSNHPGQLGGVGFGFGTGGPMQVPIMSANMTYSADGVLPSATFSLPGSNTDNETFGRSRQSPAFDMVPLHPSSDEPPSVSPPEESGHQTMKRNANIQDIIENSQDSDEPLILKSLERLAERFDKATTSQTETLLAKYAESVTYAKSLEDTIGSLGSTVESLKNEFQKLDRICQDNGDGIKQMLDAFGAFSDDVNTFMVESRDIWREQEDQAQEERDREEQEICDIPRLAVG